MLLQKIDSIFRAIARPFIRQNTDWQDAPFDNLMRRKIDGKWHYRPKTDDEERDFESRNAW